MTGGGNGPYYMIRPRPGVDETNYFLLAVLHHPLSEAMVRTRTSPFRAGYYSHGKQFIGCFRHQLLLPLPYLVLTKPLRLDIQCQRAASVKIGWKYLDD